MKKISKILSITLLGLTAACLAGCNGESEDSSGKVKITFAGRSVDSEKANYITFLTEFMETNPDVEVTMEWYSSESAYNRALAGKLKKLPHLFMLSDDQFIPYAEGGYLKDYKDYIDMDEVMSLLYHDHAESFCYNPKTDTYGWDEDNEDCGFYGFPKAAGSYALVYNKDLFTKLMNIYNEGKPASQKIAYPSVTDPMTYQQYIDLCLKLKEAYYSQSDAGTNFFPAGGYDLDSAVYSNNANYFDETATNQKINEPNFVEAIEFMANLYSQGVIAPYGGNVTSGETAFFNGKCVFWYMGPWKCKDYWTQVTSFEWDIAPMCVGPAEGAVSTAYMGGMGYVMSAKNSDAETEAACRLAKYLSCSEESQRSQYKRGQSVPVLKTLKDEYINDSKDLLGDHNPKGRALWMDVVDGYGTEKVDSDGNTYTDKITGKFRPGRYTFSSTWRNDLSNYLAGIGSRSVWKGEISAQESLDAYADDFQEVLDGLKQSQMMDM